MNNIQFNRAWRILNRILEKCCTERFLMKICSRALRTSDWDEGSPSNRTLTLSAQPRQHRSSFGTSHWMSLSGPARAWTWTRSNLSGETPSNLTERERIWRESFKKQVCQACSVIPNKIWGCNCCQRYFNKVLSKGAAYLSKCDISFYLYLFLQKNLKTCFCLVIMIMIVEDKKQLHQF